jgi:hypothetical protein
MWEVETTDAFDEWWHALTESEQGDVTTMVELLEERGAHLSYPYSSSVEGSKFSHMRELRIRSHGNPIRVFYAFDSRRVAILLIDGIKTGKEKRFYKKYIPLADRLYEQHLKSLEG